ncbi:AMP-binding protein [Pseudomaricurvus alcaniphilus]|uniref:AMP-binding protein n=1 Tax=Pseudomaricurvus alcaniphilus TaxID=1166482 RepID=UPI00140E8E66|nr:AMP-binding protein [Pseudomaricurvus alcaniphilus]NHN39248.1 AMP-binding protein [Pseudomaricurvus alcaniphilus]
MTKLRNKSLAEYAAALAATRPDDIAIYLEDAEPIRYGSIFTEAMSLAASLADLGLKAGDVVSFQLPNWRETVALDIAATWLGLVVNPVIPIYRDRELAFILADSRARCLFIPGTYRKFDYPAMIQRLQPQLPELEFVVTVRDEEKRDGTLAYEALIQADPSAAPARQAIAGDSVKLIMYTSGTTGRAKAVRHSHNSLARAIDNGVEGWGLGEGDVMLMPSPVTHVTGFANGIELPFLSGCKTAFMERWDVDQAVAYIARVKATGCVSATPFLQELVDKAERESLRLPSLRFFACGGASVPPTLIQRAHRVLENCRAFRVYGCTEAPLVTVGFIKPEEELLAGTTDGRIHNWDVVVVDDDGKPVAAGEDGELLVKGPAMMLGYGEEEQTREAVDANGYFHTGDIGHITPERAIVITDRKKDIIIRGGENLSAREIEDVLHQHELINEVAVVSMPHERLGEGVCAFVVTRDQAPLSLAQLRPFLEQRGLARQKWPERVEQVEELQKTASGKVRKDILRQQIKALLET